MIVMKLNTISISYQLCWHSNRFYLFSDGNHVAFIGYPFNTVKTHVDSKPSNN